MADNTVGEETMTPDRAALRETAERFGHMELEESDRNYVVSGLKLYDMIALCRDYLALAAPLLVKCRECGGVGKLSTVVDSASCRQAPYSMKCPACHGTGSVEREDIAAIRKRFEDAAHSQTCASHFKFHNFAPFETDMERCRVCGNAEGHMRHPFRAGGLPCNCWKSTFGLDALLDLIAAQAREIERLKGNANGTL